MTSWSNHVEALRRFIDHHGYIDSDREGEARIPYSDEDSEAMDALNALVELLNAEIARATENGRLAQAHWDRAEEAETRIAASRLLLDPDRQDEPDEENVLRAFQALTFPLKARERKAIDAELDEQIRVVS